MFVFCEYADLPAGSANYLANRRGPHGRRRLRIQERIFGYSLGDPRRITGKIPLERGGHVEKLVKVGEIYRLGCDRRALGTKRPGQPVDGKRARHRLQDKVSEDHIGTARSAVPAVDDDDTDAIQMLAHEARIVHEHLAVAWNLPVVDERI